MERHFPLSPTEFKEIYSRVPRLTVDLVIKNPSGILLTYRQAESYNNLWHLPGGTVYYNEGLEETVHRIAKEELGIEVKILKFVDILEYRDEKEDRGYGHAVSPVYLCVPISLDIVLDKTASEAKFFKNMPKRIIKDQKNFLIKHGLLSSRS